ncbi:MAG: hypothetical protein CSA81_00875 [Acidobacteria bacterium]|nr:MAG: hypothetical protein CSA81_00875 [Acidobacteriota bacterium]
MGNRILLADDSMTIQKLVEMAFADTDHELICVSHGQEAWEKMEDFRPHVVLADAIMPILDGYALCERIKQSTIFSETPVVLLTGRFQPFDEKRAAEVKIDSRMMKPFVQEQLIDLVEKLAKNAPADPIQEVDATPEQGVEDTELKYEIEHDDDGLLEEDTQSLGQMAAEGVSLVDNNSTIRVDQIELQSYLTNNRKLQFDSSEEDSEDETIDEFDLASVDDFNEDEDFLSINEDADTVETDLDSEDQLDFHEEMEGDQDDDIHEDFLSELEMVDDNDVLELDEDDFLEESGNEEWEDILEDSEMAKEDDSNELLESEDNFFSPEDEAEQVDDVFQHDIVKHEEPKEIVNRENQVENTMEEVFQTSDGEGDDPTIALDREVMNSILVEEAEEAESFVAEPERDIPGGDKSEFSTGENRQVLYEDTPFRPVEQEEPAEPGLFEKDTIPLDELEPELVMTHDEEDTLPVAKEDMPPLVTEEESEMAAHLTELPESVSSDEEHHLESEDPFAPEDEEDDFSSVDIFVDEDEDLDEDLSIDLDSDFEPEQDDQPHKKDEWEDGEATHPNSFKDEYELPDVEEEPIKFEVIEDPLFSSNDEEPLDLQIDEHEGLSLEDELELEHESDSLVEELDEEEPLESEDSDPLDESSLNPNTEDRESDAAALDELADDVSLPGESPTETEPDQIDDHHQEKAAELKSGDEEDELLSDETLSDSLTPELMVEENDKQEEVELLGSVFTDDEPECVPEKEDIIENDSPTNQAAVSDPTEVQEGTVVKLSDEQFNLFVEKVVEKVLDKLSNDAIKEVAWEVVPALAEAMVERRIMELEKE